jgi:hypothetical protein
MWTEDPNNQTWNAYIVLDKYVETGTWIIASLLAYDADGSATFTSGLGSFQMNGTSAFSTIELNDWRVDGLVQGKSVRPSIALYFDVDNLGSFTGTCRLFENLLVRIGSSF